MLGATQAVFQDGSISKATRYGITVEAVMQDGNSGLRSIRYITTPGTLPPPPVKQAAPTNLRITAISLSEFTAEWDYPTDNNISFWSIAVRQLTSYSQTGVASSGRSFTYRDLQPSSGYEIILSGLDSNGVWTQEARLGFYSPAN
jgi:chitodextrinase